MLMSTKSAPFASAICAALAHDVRFVPEKLNADWVLIFGQVHDPALRTVHEGPTGNHFRREHAFRIDAAYNVAETRSVTPAIGGT